MVVPYKEANSSKKEQIRQMFDAIAPKYDFLNHFLTVGIDKSWRRNVCKIVAEQQPQHIMDMASGTGDLAIALSKLQPKEIVALDISEKMLEIGREKVKKRGLADLITFRQADAEALQENEETFDAVTCAFGVRNFEDIDKGLSEFYRVLKKKGRLVILELSVPENKLFRMGYNIYFHHILPLWGRLVSKDVSAYSYLPESVANFPKNTAFLQKLEAVGFQNSYAKSLSFGIATIFVATK